MTVWVYAYIDHVSPRSVNLQDVQVEVTRVELVSTTRNRRNSKWLYRTTESVKACQTCINTFPRSINNYCPFSSALPIVKQRNKRPSYHKLNIRYQYHLHHLKMQQTQILQIENELSTMSLKKSVSFSETTSTYNYPRPSAEDIDELYWQENDYRRFREQKWLDDLRRARPTSAAAPKRASRRDSLNMMMNDGPSTPTKQGIAQAA